MNWQVGSLQSQFLFLCFFSKKCAYAALLSEPGFQLSTLEFLLGGHSGALAQRPVHGSFTTRSAHVGLAMPQHTATITVHEITASSAPPTEKRVFNLRNCKLLISLNMGF